jgi:hypothetical protein
MKGESIGCAASRPHLKDFKALIASLLFSVLKYYALIRNLQNEGEDQLQKAVTRIQKGFKKNKYLLSVQEQRKINFESREMELDAISSDIKNIIQKCYFLSRQQCSLSDDDNDELSEDDTSMSNYNDDDGPTQQEVLGLVVDDATQMMNQDEEKGEAPFDPHMHATRKRRGRSIRSHKSNDRKETKKIRSASRARMQRRFNDLPGAPFNQSTGSTLSGGKDASRGNVDGGSSRIQSPDCYYNASRVGVNNVARKVRRRAVAASSRRATDKDSLITTAPQTKRAMSIPPRQNRGTDGNLNNLADGCAFIVDSAPTPTTQSQRKARRRQIIRKAGEQDQDASSRHRASNLQSNNLEGQGLIKEALFNELATDSLVRAKEAVREPTDAYTARQTDSDLGVSICQHSHPEQSKAASSNNTSDHSMFQRLWTSLIENNCPTIQSLIARESDALSTHVDIIVKLLRLLRLRASNLPDEQPLYGNFSRECYGYLKSFVLLQLVDSVFSLVHSSAWALPVKNCRVWLDHLRPILDELDHDHSLLDRVCDCVTRDLQPQTWYLTSNGHAFVSCVNATDWANFLASDGALRSAKVGTSRFKLFDSKLPLPRCELDALWCLLAFFSQATQKKGSASTWALVHVLIERGIFKRENTTIAPSDILLTKTATELQNVCSLLTAGKLECPANDSNMLKLLKNCILLQEQYYSLNDVSRMDLLLSAELKAAGKYFNLFWNQIFTVETPAQNDFCRVSMPTVDIARPQLRCGRNQADRTLLLPIDPLLRLCLGLICSWFNSISVEKKARRKRLKEKIKALFNEILESQQSVDKENLCVHAVEATRSSTFEDEFAESPKRRSASKAMLGDRNCRAYIFLKESAAYVAIVSHICFKERQTTGARALSEHVWNLLADDAMLADQRRFFGGDSVAPLSHNKRTDPYLCYTAAKALSFVTLLFLGLQPWCFCVHPQPAFSDYFTMFTDEDDTTLYFLISCLVSCLKRLCDCVGDSMALSSISLMIGSILYRCLELVLRQDLPAGLSQQIRALLHSHAPRILPVIKRCLVELTAASVCQSEDDMAISSLLSLLNLILLGSRPDQLSPAVHMQTTCDDPANEIWGDLDDELLAGVDLGTGIPANSYFLEICDLLEGFLDQAKPSRRFAVPEFSAARRVETGSSSQGKIAINRHLRKVCRCFTAILSDHVDSHRLTMTLSRYLTPVRTLDLGGGLPDADYHKKVAISFVINITRVAADSTKVALVVKESIELITFNLVQQVLDTKVLEKLPSNNFSRMHFLAGPDGEKESFINLTSTCTTSKRQNLLWEYKTSLAKVFDGDEVGRWLAVLDPDIQTFHNSFPKRSLEYECLDRFQQLRVIFGAPFVSREHLLPVVIGTSSDQLLQIENCMLRVEQEQTPGCWSYSDAKMIEVYACYTEIYIALIAWMFRETTICAEGQVQAVREKVCNGFLAPLLSKRTVDTRDVMYQLVRDCADIIEGRSLRSKAFAQRTLIGSGRLTELLPAAIARYCRDFMIFIAREHRQSNGTKQSSLFHALLFSDYPKEVASSFSATRNTSLVSKTDPISFSPLQRGITEYLAHVEDHYAIRSEDRIALLDLKRYALQNILAPELLLEKSIGKRTSSLTVVRYMLDAESGESTTLDEAPRMELKVLCSLTKGIRLSIQSSLASNEVDEALVVAAYRCATSLVTLPTACVDTAHVGWLIDWSAMVDADAHSLERCFLWCFVLWMKELGGSILDTRKEKYENRLTAFRDVLRREKAADKRASTLHLHLHGCGLWNDMIAAEMKLFPASTATTNIVNVYKKLQVNHEGTFQEWKPSMAVHRAASVFVMKVTQVEASL